MRLTVRGKLAAVTLVLASAFTVGVLVPMDVVSVPDYARAVATGIR